MITDRKNLRILPILFFLALTLNIFFIDSSVIQPDEYHWVARAKKLYVMLDSDISRATHHLGQPGITPTFIMTAGIYVIKHFYFHLGLSLENFNYLQACRLSIAFFSALIAPLAFLGMRFFFGLRLSFFLALLLLLDPRILANSRMAHLDMSQGVLIMMTFLLYFSGVEKARHSLKILSGFFWGLAFATKPTSLFLMIAFCLYRLSRFVAQKIYKVKIADSALVSYSDIAAFFVGQGIFCLLYTRFWYHPSDYSGRLGIKSALADFIYQSGMIFHNHLIMSLVILTLIAIGSFYLINRKATDSKIALNVISSLVLIFMLVLSIWPQVLENLVLFWTWTAGLSGEVHKTFGYVAKPPPWRYLELILSILNDILLFGMLLAFIGACVNFRKGLKSFLEREIVYVMIPLIWVLFLNTSDKQSWRYVIPVVPFFYFIACAGFRFITDFIKGKKVFYLAGVLLLISVSEIISWSPHFQLYYNKISGSLSGAVARGQAFEFTGAGPVADYLITSSDCSPERICNVTLFGDPRIFSSYIFRTYGQAALKSFRFEYFRPYQADYVIYRDSDAEHKDGEIWPEIFKRKPDFIYSFKGVELLKVIKIPAYDFNKPIKLKAGDFPYITGVPVKTHHGLAMLVNPNKHALGNVMFSAGYMAQSAAHYFKVNVWRKKSAEPLNTKEDPVVLKLKLDSCETAIKASEVGSNPKTFEVVCDNKADNKIFPQVIWEGVDTLLIKDFEIGRKNN